VNTRTITAALVAFTMIVMATSPLIDNTNELRPNGIVVEFDHGGGGVANGTATLGGILTWQDDAWDSTWNCSGGLSLVTPNDWSNFVASGENDPHNYTSWGIALTGAGSYYTEYAPAGEWVVTAGLGCMDDAGEPRAAGGQFGDVHENPPTVNLTNTSTVADVSFTLIEYSEDDYPTFVCGDGEEIPFDWVNDGYEDCADGSDEPQDYDGDGVTDNWFNCMDGTNISMDLVNDGYDDCPDGDDEAPDAGSLEDIMAELDADGDGNLSLEELIDFVNAESNDETGENISQEEEDMLTDAFNESDADGNGLLDLDELEYLFNLFDEMDNEHTFVCGDGEEIPFDWVNDGYEDCTDGSDEPQDFDGDGVTDNWFDCHDGTNISMDLVNDGNDDCPDGEDESPSDNNGWTGGDAIINATTDVQDDYFENNYNSNWSCDGGVGLMTAEDYDDWNQSGDPYSYLSWGVELWEEGNIVDYTAPEGMFYVVSGLDCEDDEGVYRDYVGVAVDAAGEAELMSFLNGTETLVFITLTSSGSSDYFTCNDGTTIPNEWVNDGHGDCPDGEDEGVSGGDFTCNDGTTIPNEWVNDGYEDCADGEDEDGGGGDYFTCYDGSTIPNDWVNDGDEDCPDGEDENGSGGEMTFVCGNGEEIPFDWVNDGEEDCDDGSDEPQDFDGDGVTDNWFDCHDGTNISMDLVNDGEYNCPDGEDEGVQEAEDDVDCTESGLQMSLHYDAAGDIYFEMAMECAFSQEDSDDLRAMYDMYFGDGDGILNESEAAIFIEMVAEETSEETSEACEEWEYWNPELINESLPGNGCPEYVEDSDGDDGNWTIDGISVEMTENVGVWDDLADPSVPISMSMTMTTDSIADDGTGTHTVMYVSNPDYDDGGDDSGECISVFVVSNSDFAPTSVVFTPATQFTIEDNGDYFEFTENPDSTTGVCGGGQPGSATIVFESVEEVVVEPVDTEPTCAYSWTAATDTSWESESGITLGPDGDVNMTFVPGSYMIAVQCTDAENDVVNASWATADGTLSASETGSGTVFGWVQFTIPEGITGTMEVEYAWDSTTFGSDGTFTFDFASNETAAPGAAPSGTGGGIPGFTSVLTVSALLGAAMILARRKD